MKIRMAIIGFIIVLSVAGFLLLENREINMLMNGDKYPVMEAVRDDPIPINNRSVPINDTGIEMTKLYTLPKSEKLYLGLWYRKGNRLMNSQDEEQSSSQDSLQFLVKAVDSQGTTYNGTTMGKVDGTFSTFRYVKLDSYNHHEGIGKLAFSFYPFNKEDRLPNEKPMFEVSVSLQ